MQTPEQKGQNTIEANLKKFQKQGEPLFFEKRQAGGWNYKKGMPDLYVVYKGIHYEFEIKKYGCSQYEYIENILNSKLVYNNNKFVNEY